MFLSCASLACQALANRVCSNIVVIQHNTARGTEDKRWPQWSVTVLSVIQYRQHVCTWTYEHYVSDIEKEPDKIIGNLFLHSGIVFKKHLKGKSAWSTATQQLMYLRPTGRSKVPGENNKKNCSDVFIMYFSNISYDGFQHRQWSKRVKQTTKMHTQIS